MTSGFDSGFDSGFGVDQTGMGVRMAGYRGLTLGLGLTAPDGQPSAAAAPKGFQAYTDHRIIMIEDATRGGLNKRVLTWTLETVITSQIPTMTSDVLPAPYVAATNSSTGTGVGFAFQAFDTNDSTHVQLDSEGEWVSIHSDTPVTVNRFRIRDNDSAGRGLGAFAFQGSNDNFVSDINTIMVDTTGVSGADRYYYPQPAGFYNPYALDFDGIDEQVTVPLASTPDILADNTPFTLVWWQDNDVAQDGYISITSAPVGGNPGFRLFSADSGAQLFLRLKTRTGQEISPNATNPSGWTQYVVTYDGLETMTIYRNGVFDNDESFAGFDGKISPVGNGGDQLIYIGRDRSKNFGNTALDQIAYYGGVAATLADAADMYNGGVPKPPQQTPIGASLLHYWPLGEGDQRGIANRVPDKVGGADGTAANMDDTNFVAGAS